jgi:hypothetical protein
MADNPIPPVDPITPLSRLVGTTRHVEAFDAPPRPDAAMQRQWQEALARELAKAKAEAVRREDRSMLSRWREVARALWPVRPRADDGSGGSKGG